MEISGVLNALFRWLHVIAGIVWIGHLYFFNFVNIPFAAKMKEAGAAKTVVPELMPRALWWFRWGAAWTWITGMLLLVLVFYHGGLLFEDPEAGSMAGILISLAIVLGAVFIYDAIYKSPIAATPRNAHTLSYALTVGLLLLMASVLGLSYRAYNIHIGAMFGTMMAFNVWFRIWPAQQKIIAAVKAGEAPDPALPALAGGRSRHNTYLSVPLVWTMINMHTTSFSGSMGWVVLAAMILIGWHLVFQFYAKSAKIEGM